MFRDLLNLEDAVQIGRVTETVDTAGSVSAATVLTTISRAAIWQAGSSNARISDKIARDSTHILAIETGAYSFVVTDDIVTYDGDSYTLTGKPDDVMQKGEITVVGLELIE